MKTRIITTVAWALILATAVNASAEQKASTAENRHSISFNPMVPVVGIYALHYTYQLNGKSDFIAGVSFMNIKFEGSGHSNSPALIVGYRRYLWKGLHLEYEIWPAYDAYYEKNEDRFYKGFDLWNEFRLGYKYSFTAGNRQLYANLQWPFGFGLYASNKPDSFWELAENNKYFYFPPLLSFGISF